jgi:hypothetical protein
VVIAKHIDLYASTVDVTGSYTPAAGETLTLLSISTQGPGNGVAKGSVVFDADVVDGWAGDKAYQFEANQSAFVFTGDGVKKLFLRLENTDAVLTYRIGATLVFRSSIGG